MTKAISDLNDEQLGFIHAEFGVAKEQLFSMSDSEIYDAIYDKCCVIEEVETVATLADDSELSERGRIAAEIVTVLGGAIEDN